MGQKKMLFCGMDKKIEKTELRREKMRRIAKYCVGCIAAAGIIAFALSFLEKGVKRTGITIAEADCGELETTISASGRVVPAFEEIINSPVNTRIVEVFAQPGDSVKAGTALLALDLETEQTNYEKLLDQHNISQQQLRQQQLTAQTQLSELAMQIEVKEMEVNRLKIDVENERKLDSLGSGTGERVRQAEASYSAGVLELRQMRQRLSNERLRNEAADRVSSLNASSIGKDLELMRRTLHRSQIQAPHDGIVTYIISDLGTQVGAGEKVAVVSDLSNFKIIGEIAEGSSDKIGIGSKVTARIGNTSLSGHVSNITPQSKGGLITFVVTLDNPQHSRLRSGLRTELYVNYGYKDNAVRIPTGEYFKGPGEYDLFVADSDNNLERRHVRLGDSNREYVEVVSGLRAGEKVVTSDMSKYQNKTNLKIKD